MQARIGAIMLFATAVFTAVPATAQVVHSVQVGAGFFNPRGLDSRVFGDVLVRNATGAPLDWYPDLSDALVFDMGQFLSGQVSGEWNVAFGNHIEIGAGVGWYSDSVPSVYYDLVDEGGREIVQTLALRIVPTTAVVRFLPFGRAGDIQPYVGAGVGLFNYRYSEYGEFVWVDEETLDLVIRPEQYTATGWAPGGVVLGGLRVPLGGDVFGLTFEGRYQFATGETGGIEAGFLDEKIDLDGGQFNVGLLVRF
jgi:hypothetical protein